VIDYKEIRRQAERVFPIFLIAYLASNNFFPWNVRFSKIKPSDALKKFQDIHLWINALREKSKETTGHGYIIEYGEVRNQLIGRQAFPKRIYFDSTEDYLRFLGKEKEFALFKDAVIEIRASLPALESWLRKNPLKIIENLGQWTDLIKVCVYFVENPRPNLYIRELPVEVHTKFIEESKGILRQLLDELIRDAINREEGEFEKRFHLKYGEPLIRIRILDEELTSECFSGVSDISITHSEFCRLNIPCSTVFIMENKTNFSNFMNFLTIPSLKRSMAVFGKGYQIQLLKEAYWLQGKRIIYWGDIDIQGFQILSQLRSYLPQTESLMMDFETLDAHDTHRVTGPRMHADFSLPNLTDGEQEIFQYLLSLMRKNRLEQERITHAYASRRLLDCVGQISPSSRKSKPPARSTDSAERG